MDKVQGTTKRLAFEAFLRKYQIEKGGSENSEKSFWQMVEKVSYKIYFSYLNGRTKLRQEDFLQNCRVKIFEEAGNYKEEKAKISTYVYRLCLYEALESLGRLKPNPKRQIISIDDGIMDKHGAKISFDSFAAKGIQNANCMLQGVFTPSHEDEILNDSFLKEVLNRLPEKQKEAIRLMYIDQYSVNDISAMLKVPATTVNNWLARGRKNLKAMEGFAHADPSVFFILPLSFFQKKSLLFSRYYFDRRKILILSF